MTSSTPTSVRRKAHTCPVLKQEDILGSPISEPVDTNRKQTIQNSEITNHWASKAEHSNKMSHKYTIIKALDKGSFGEVSLATLNPNGASAGTGTASVTTCTATGLRRNSSESIFVIKKIDKEKANDTLLTNEIEAGSRLKESSHIPKFVESYTDTKYCYMVFEYFQGMNLYSFLESRNFKPLREHQVKRIMRQLVDALIYSHQNKICHRDLKLENILYNHKKRRANLIDFGLCAINSISCADICNNWCGSPDYVCPEILIQQPYSGCLSDVWSLGIILYVLLFGQMPFNFKERYYALQHGDGHPELEFPNDKDVPHRVSEQVKDLMKKMLTIDPRQRISMEEIPHTKWMKKSMNILSLFGLKSHTAIHKDEHPHTACNKGAAKEEHGDSPAQKEEGDQPPSQL